jgi:hypothetical protein
MTIALAIEYIPRRMKDLGVGNEYYLRFRHLVIPANQTVTLEADNQFFILVEEPKDVSIRSDAAHFDLSDFNLNEQDYEHQGTILINNYSSNVTHVRFIQVIPIN